jgi:hypothetical protein
LDLVTLIIQGGSNMTGTNCDLFTHNKSQSYLNHLVFGNYKLWSSLCSFLWFLITSSLLGPNIFFLSTLFLNTLSLYSYFSERGKVSKYTYSIQFLMLIANKKVVN